MLNEAKHPFFTLGGTDSSAASRPRVTFPDNLVNWQWNYSIKDRTQFVYRYCQFLASDELQVLIPARRKSGSR